MKVIYLILVCAVLLTGGQVLWKHGLQAMGGFNPSFRSLATDLLPLMRSPYILAGLVLYVIATILWMSVLSRAPFSVAYPLMSVSYVLGVVAACLVFREKVPLVRWMGTIVVCFGIYLIARK